MAEKTKIQWCHHTFNPWIGCTKVNEGCKFCYAETLMDTRYGRVIWGPNGTRSRTKTWADPVRWNKAAAAAGERHKVFCASLADVFEDFHGAETKDGLLAAGGHDDALAPWRSDLFKLIDRCTYLDWLLLTKRPENVRRMWRGLPRSNVWIGTSIANQKNADDFIPRLLSCRGLGAYLFLSVEPQIGEVDIFKWLCHPVINWVIVGGESKQGSGKPRPFQLHWARLIVRQCADASVPCFVKQLGSNAWDDGQHVDLNDSHGGNWDEWPEELRVRQCPEMFYTSFTCVAGPG